MNLSRSIDYNVLLVYIKQKSSLKIKQEHRSRGKGAYAPAVKVGGHNCICQEAGARGHMLPLSKWVDKIIFVPPLPLKFYWQKIETIEIWKCKQKMCSKSWDIRLLILSVELFTIPVKRSFTLFLIIYYIPVKHLLFRIAENISF